MKKQKRSFISAQHASENVPDPTNNNSNLERAPVHYEAKNHLLYKNFDNLQSRSANLKSVENLKKEFKCEKFMIKKWSPTHLLLYF